MAMHMGLADTGRRGTRTLHACRHRWLAIAAASTSLITWSGCAIAVERDADEHVAHSALTTLAPRLDPNTIPKFAHELPRFATFKPRLIYSFGRLVRAEYDVSIAKFMDQQLPPGFPQTQLFGYGGEVFSDVNTTDAVAASEA